jgi:hypothetical protein
VTLAPLLAVLRTVVLVEKGAGLFSTLVFGQVVLNYFAAADIRWNFSAKQRIFIFICPWQRRRKFRSQVFALSF